MQELDLVSSEVSPTNASLIFVFKHENPQESNHLYARPLPIQTFFGVLVYWYTVSFVVIVVTTATLALAVVLAIVEVFLSIIITSNGLVVEVGVNLWKKQISTRAAKLG
jgi:hypothetical protein